MSADSRLRIGFIPLADATALLIAVDKGFAPRWNGPAERSLSADRTQRCRPPRSGAGGVALRADGALGAGALVGRVARGCEGGVSARPLRRGAAGRARPACRRTGRRDRCLRRACVRLGRYRRAPRRLEDSARLSRRPSIEANFCTAQNFCMNALGRADRVLPGSCLGPCASSIYLRWLGFVARLELGMKLVKRTSERRRHR